MRHRREKKMEKKFGAPQILRLPRSFLGYNAKMALVRGPGYIIQPLETWSGDMTCPGSQASQWRSLIRGLAIWFHYWFYILSCVYGWVGRSRNIEIITSFGKRAKKRGRRLKGEEQKRKGSGSWSHVFPFDIVTWSWVSSSFLWLL